MSKCNDYPVRAIPGEEIPRWEKTVLPEEGYLLMAAVLKDQQCGRNLPFLYHLPISTLTPGSTFQGNTYSARANGSTIAVPADQVVPAFVYSSTPNDIRLAKKGESAAQFLVIAKDEGIDGNLIIQANGFYTFKSGHKYIPGFVYYLGTDGKPTTDSTFLDGKRQKLFTVIDSRTISINIQEERE